MRLVTWNMQGSKADTENLWHEDVAGLFSGARLSGGAADVVCLQEAGPCPPSGYDLDKAWNSKPGLKWCGWYVGTQKRAQYHCLWLQTDTGGNRVNMAICSKDEPSQFLFVDSPKGGRPAVGLLFGGLAVFSVHAWSGGGADAPALMDQIKTVSKTWIAAGDFNRDPSSWDKTGYAGLLNCSGEATQKSGGELDYMICSGGKVAKASLLDLNASDHKALLFTL